MKQSIFFVVYAHHRIPFYARQYAVNYAAKIAGMSVGLVRIEVKICNL